MTYERVKYRKLERDESDSYVDGQFEERKPSVPWKAIAFASLLTTVGFSLLVFGVLIVSGLADIKYADRMWPVLILGALMFLPGAYHVRIAYYAFTGRQGYTFEEIPEFD